MNNHTVGRINHADHLHPQTSWFRKLCRDSMIETGQPYVDRSDPVSLGLGAPAEADIRDADEVEPVGTYSVEAGHDEPKPVTPPIVTKPFFMPMDQIVDLDEMLGRLNEVLDGYAVTTSAVIRFDKDGLDLAVIWNGEAWGVQVG